MYRWDIINLFIEKHDYKSYLEIGVYEPNSLGASFSNIKIENKVSVDPSPLEGEVDFKVTSDEYFENLDPSVMFDIIFIDGLHHNDQVLRDISNSLKHLNDEGTIVVHDCLPHTFEMQVREKPVTGAWTGDVWKAIAELRTTVTDLEIRVVDTDFGCGIIRRGKNIPYNITTDDYLNYNYYTQHKQELLNVITVENFLNYYIVPTKLKTYIKLQ